MSAQFIIRRLNLIFYYIDKLYTDRLKKASFAVNIHLFIFLVLAVQKRLRVTRIVGLLLIAITFARQQQQHSNNTYGYLISIALGKISKHLKYVL